MNQSKSAMTPSSSKRHTLQKAHAEAAGNATNDKSSGLASDRGDVDTISEATQNNEKVNYIENLFAGVNGLNTLALNMLKKDREDWTKAQQDRSSKKVLNEEESGRANEQEDDKVIDVADLEVTLDDLVQKNYRQSVPEVQEFDDEDEEGEQNQENIAKQDEMAKIRKHGGGVLSTIKEEEGVNAAGSLVVRHSDSSMK